MSRRQALAAKRAMLVARSELQRRDLALSTGDIAHSLRKVDAAVGVARRAAAHPLLLAGAVAVVVAVIRPRRLLGGLTWGLSAAVAAQRAASLLRAGV
jgi:YqjK-like protein